MDLSRENDIAIYGRHPIRIARWKILGRNSTRCWLSRHLATMDILDFISIAWKLFLAHKASIDSARTIKSWNLSPTFTTIAELSSKVDSSTCFPTARTESSCFPTRFSLWVAAHKIFTFYRSLPMSSTALSHTNLLLKTLPA